MAPVLTLAELDDRLHRFVVEEYHRRVHGETELAPQDRWEAGGFLPRLPDSAEQLDLLLLTVAKARRVHRDGIHFQGLRYLDLTLAAYVGEEVTIRYDPGDLTELHVYHHDRFLCRAVCPDLAGETMPLREVIQARNRRRREVRGLLQDRLKTVDALLERKCDSPAAEPEPGEGKPQASPPLKRYFNE